MFDGYSTQGSPVLSRYQPITRDPQELVHGAKGQPCRLFPETLMSGLLLIRGRPLAHSAWSMPHRTAAGKVAYLHALNCIS